MSKVTKSDRRRDRRRMRPNLTSLEDRNLLSTFTVTSLADTSTNGVPTTGTLRWAIGQANAAGGSNAINFAPSFNNATSPLTITLGGTQLELSDTTGTESITGPAGGVTVSGGGLSRVFQIDDNVTASISGLTITGGDAGTYGYGAGVLDYGTASLTNCTISGNSGQGSVDTGSYSYQGASLSLANCSVVGNSGSFGGLDTLFAPTTLTNTILADNTLEYGIYSILSYFDPLTGTNNLIDTGLSGELVNGVGGNIVGVSNPGLSPLGNYGGTAETVALLPGSPAIDAGTSAGAPAVDERGMGRVGAPDIGAFESQGFTITPLPGTTPQSAAIGTAFKPLAVSVTAKNPLEPVNGGTVQFVAQPSSGGASAITLANTAVITNGTASIAAAPNNADGSFTVSATIGEDSGSFALTNTGKPFASLVVNTGGDALAPGAGLVSLREAVGFDDASTTGNAPITFDASKGGAFSVARTITLANGPLTLSNPKGTISIAAPPAGLTIGGGQGGDFLVAPNVTASLTGLAITGGKTSGNGGGVLSDGNTTLTKCTITGNSAGGSGGGVYGAFGSTSLINSTISGNSAGDSGGGLDFGSGTASLVNATISGNTASIGGGLASSGSLTMVNSTVSDNTAGSYGTGGGLDFGGGSASLTGCTIIGNQSGASGGGLYDGGAALNMANCVVSDNSKIGWGGGGGVAIGGVQATLAGCTISGNIQESGPFFNGFNGGGGLVEQGATLTMTGDKVSDNQAGDWGGGLSLIGGTTTLTACTVSGNSTTAGPSPYGGSYGGGGLWASGGASATLNGCTFKGNSSGDVGGALYLGDFFGDATVTLNGGTISGNSAVGDGGGLFNLAGTANLVGCTVSGNSAADGGGVATQAVIFTFYNTYVFPGATDLTGCTVSGNTATGAGGGLGNQTDCTTTVTGNTVTNNSAAAGGGIANQGTLTVDSSTINKNRATSQGGGISTTGGTATITNSSINNNQVNAPSGGTALGGGIDSENTTLSFSDDTINSNQANGATAFGGGLYLLDGSANLEGCIISSNQANGTTTGEGGGIYDDGGQLTLDSATKVKKNSASTLGGDIFVK